MSPPDRMTLTPVAADAAPQPEGGYTQAALLEGHRRLLFISGQVPTDRHGTTPTSFSEQCELVWAHVLAQLDGAGMGVRNLVKVTTFLASRDDAEMNSQIRQRVLNGHAPALTVIVTGIYDEAWRLEIEAVAAD